MTKPRALVVTGDGINCDYETSWALSLAGFAPARISATELFASPQALLNFQLCAIPGGFSFGDEIASGKVLAVKLKERLSEQLYKFVDSKGLLLGICNGFQVLVQLGLLPNAQPDKPRMVSLLHNDGGKFINRWVRLQIDAAVPTPFFKGLNEIDLPIRHGEGRITLASDAQNSDEELIKKRAPLRYSADVNGSFDRIAALTDASGHVMGLMPHPEAFVRWTQHPAWTSRKFDQRFSPEEPHGLTLFRNAAAYFA